MTLLDGKALSAEMQEQMKQEVVELTTNTGRAPGLTVLLVGDDEASQVYVGSKDRMARNLGLRSEVVRLPADASERQVMDVVEQINQDHQVDGLLIQLPLPRHLDSWKILERIDPGKDVDGFLPRTQGNVLLDRSPVAPCTPAGVMRLLDRHGIDPTGKRAVVLGRSFIVGKPMAAMLLNRHATVTICHTRTRELAEETRRADILVAAAGVPGVIGPDMVKEGAVLVDVGIHTITDPAWVEQYGDESTHKRFARKSSILVGDIQPRTFARASAYTPVPGGVGPLTVTMLMANTLTLFRQRMNLD